jgi:hypothetical protein
MLPPSWKGEANKLEEEETHVSTEQQEISDRSTEIAAALNRFDNSYNTQNNKPERKDKARAFIDIATILLLFGTALFTGLTWFVFRGQLQEMQKAYGAIKESAEAAKSSAEAAKSSAEAAKEAVELSDRTAERRLRAYVDISDIGINVVTIPGGNDAKIVGVLVVKNFGATPSNNVEISARTVFRKYPLGPIPLPERSANPIVTARFAPGQERKVNIPMEEPAITPEQRASREKEAIAAYFYGTIKYNDVFERTCTIYFRALRSKTDGDISRFALEGNSVECSKE